MDEALRQYQLDMARATISRRRFMAGAALAGTAAFLAACAPAVSTSAPSAAAPSAAPPSAAPGDTGTAASASAAPSMSAEASAAATPAPSYALEQNMYLYNWTDYFSPDNLKAYQDQFGVTLTQTTFASNEEMLAKLQAGGKGQYDIAVPTAEFSATLAKGGFLQKLDKSRLPNLARRQPAIPDAPLRPQRRLHRPQGLGHHRDHLPRQQDDRPDDLVEGLLRPREDASTRARRSWWTRSATCSWRRCGCTAIRRQHHRQERAGDRAPGAHGAAAAPPVDRLGQLPDDAPEGAGGPRASAWNGSAYVLQSDPSGKFKDTGWVIPTEGTIFWVDTWVLVAEAPDPNAAYAFLNWIQDPKHQVTESQLRGLRQLQRRGQAAPARRLHRQPRRLRPRRPAEPPVRGHRPERQPAAHRHLGRSSSRALIR